MLDFFISNLRRPRGGLFIFFNRFVQRFLESYSATTKQMSKEIDGTNLTQLKYN